MINHVIQNLDGTFTVRPSTQLIKENSIGTVPDDIDVSDWEYVTATEVIDLNGSPQWVISVDTEAKSTAESQASEKASASLAYEEMLNDIYTEMYNVFGTNSTETATADHETWKKMVDSSGKFADIGVTVRVQVLSSDGSVLFSAGDVLDTAQKVSDYAVRKLEQADDYAVYRLTRKQQYINSRP